MNRKIIHNMPAEQYHAHPAVNKSLLDQVARSPLHAQAYLHGVRSEPTPAMKFGTAVHTAILEPTVFNQSYVLFTGDRRTKAGKEEYERLTLGGANIINLAEYDAISAMQMAVRNHPVARELLHDGKAEQSVFWTDPDTGLECKCRTDYWRDDIVVDLKTTEDASPEGFARSIATYRYHVQAAHYSAGTQAERFLFVVVEKKPPYAVAVYELDEISLELGQAARMQDMAVYAECVRENRWPGYAEDVTPVSIPAWAFPKTEVTEEVTVEFV